MGSRFHPHFYARDYAKCVVAKGKCQIDGPPKDYLPLFNVVDFSSHGFRTLFGSWIVRRPVNVMSNPEADVLTMFHAPAYHVVNICEQVALDPAITIPDAIRLGIDHPAIRGVEVIMSTDFLVTFRRPGGILERWAFAVKRAQDLNPRVIKKLALELSYWKQRNIPFSLLLDTRLPRRLIANMELVMEFAEEGRLPCDAAVVERVSAWIIPHLQDNTPLRRACSRCDLALELQPGTSLSVAYHLIVKGTLPLDMTDAPLFNGVWRSAAMEAVA